MGVPLAPDNGRVADVDTKTFCALLFIYREQCGVCRTVQSICCNTFSYPLVASLERKAEVNALISFVMLHCPFIYNNIIGERILTNFCIAAVI